MAFGAELGDSDFGDGALRLSGFMLRMWCTNTATTEDVLNQVHLGKRLSDTVQFSKETLQLDTKAFASAIRQANEAKVEPREIVAWSKKNLNKGEAEKAVEHFNSPDVEMLPAGQTKWRWSNALSWLANETEDDNRKLELQDFSGKVLAAK